MKRIILVSTILTCSIVLPGSYAQAITVTSTYTYDAINRLTHVVYQTGLDVAYQYDAAGNIMKITGQPGTTTPTLTEAINILQVVAGKDPSGVTTAGDVNDDGRIGLPEAINVLQKLSQ